MTTGLPMPVGVVVARDIEKLPPRADGTARAKPFRARVRWRVPKTNSRKSRSQVFATEQAALDWIDDLVRSATRGLDPNIASASLADYGNKNLSLIMRGLEPKSGDPYLAGWRKRVVPTVGHLPVTLITNGLVDRAVVSWIESGCSRSTVRNTIAMFGRVMDQAMRDDLIGTNPVRVRGWQRLYRQVEAELDEPRKLALPDWDALMTFADALVSESADHYEGWGDVVVFAACTASRIGEVSGCRVRDIDTDEWMWTVRRQTTPGPGGLADKTTKSKRARTVPLIVEIQELVQKRLALVGDDPDARLFTGPKGGRIQTGVLHRATHWDVVAAKLGYEHLRRHGLRHTGLTWMADAGVPVHHLQQIAGHADLTTTQRYLHPDRQTIIEAGQMLSIHLGSTTGPQLRVVR
ncbi:tyrosine-type recombinase/integrase [Aldersonia kunmingensis]|uniref:tyrosine-type recombinase/integrase n=1 Tax=Aldersonia kunmingensis TaxID=408066 RepID=UPI0008373570|nr:site-specific integrase [Aldersonia kunmingensis]